MPTLEPVGKVTDVKLRKAEPASVPIVGYSKKGLEVETIIRFAGKLPAGVALDMIKVTDINGNVDYNEALKYVDGCVLDDDREKWDKLVHDTDVIIDQSTVLDVYVKLGEFYTGRFTKRRSGSRTGEPSTKPTSRPAARSRKPTPTDSH